MTLLQQANRALQRRDYVAAIPLYVHALLQHAPLAPALIGSLYRAQKIYLTQSAKQLNDIKPCVLICGWDLSRNAAGRAATLAQIWAGIGQAEIMGCLYSPARSQLWLPIRGLELPIRPLLITPEQSFIQQALSFVLGHPCDLLHLSKPRLPNILLGLLYKLIWACPVIVDIDDEELAFVDASSPINLDDYLQFSSKVPDAPPNLWDALSTRLGVGLADAFDAITTVNPALQQRYGGTIVHHARDLAQFAPNAQRRSQARARLGIADKETVIIFAGTPRLHKGLLETAQAIAQQQGNDLIFLIVGNFPSGTGNLQQQIAKMPGLKTIMLPDQDFQNLPDILAAGDITVLLQDMNSLAAQFQTPAKLTDALALGLTVLATPTPALADLAAQGAFIPVPPGQLTQVLATTLAQRQNQTASAPAALPLFEQMLSTSANQPALRQLWQSTAAKPQGLNARLLELAMLLPEIAPLIPGVEKAASS